MEVIVKKNYEEMSKAAATLFAAEIMENPKTILGMATGSTPVGLYKELVKMYEAGDLDFSQVTTFNLDEYIGLAPEHDQSYHYFMNDNLFDHVNINKETQIVTDLIGQYSINYTGDANFFGFYGYYENNNYNEMVKDTDFKATVDTIGKDKIVNSSIASLKKTDGATQIEAAYLVWETSVQGKNKTDLVKKAANKAIYFAGATDKGAFTKKVNASYAAVDMREPHLGTKEYTFSCMYTDVTATVQKYGYGKYGVANIPYVESTEKSNTSKGTHSGESSAAWQLIVIEKCQGCFFKSRFPF